MWSPPSETSRADQVVRGLFDLPHSSADIERVEGDVTGVDNLLAAVTSELPIWMEP